MGRILQEGRELTLTDCRLLGTAGKFQGGQQTFKLLTSEGFIRFYHLTHFVVTIACAITGRIGQFVKSMTMDSLVQSETGGVREERNETRSPLRICLGRSSMS